jgi:hypothetical protein
MLIKRILIPGMVILTFVLQLMTPVVVRADDGAPPPDSTEVAPVVVEEVPPPDPTEVALAVVEEVPTVPEILDQAPGGTEIVVQNPDGSIEPLATQAAAAAIATSDPVWCPALQVTPTPGANGCTIAHSDFTSLLADSTISGPGTVYIENGNYAGPETSIQFNGSTLTTWGALTLDGGWDLTLLSPNYGTQIGTSTFTVPIFVTNWGTDVTVNNINIDLTSYTPDSYGLDVETTGDNIISNAITVNNVDVTGAGYDGAYLDNCVMVPNPDPDIPGWVCNGSSNVLITDSTFDLNGGAGLYVDGAGLVTLNMVGADGNATGADLNADGGILVANPPGFTFNGNDYNGLYAGTSSGDVILNNVTASDNQYGAIVGTDTGNITVSGGTFNSNNTPDPELDGLGIGLQAGTSLGDVSLSFVTATGNDIGATVGSEQGNVNVAASTFSDNGYAGLAAGTMQGTVTLTDVVANNTLGDLGQDIGAIVGNMNGSITIMGSIFNGNTEKGLYIESNGVATDPDVTLLGVTALDNGWKGAYIDYLAPCGTTTGGVNVSLNSGDYETNGGYGIYAAIGPDGTLTTVAPPLLGDNGGATGLSIYDIVVDNSVSPCPPPEEPKSEPEPKPYHVVEVPGTGGEPVEQNCTDYIGTVLVLPGDDRATLKCPATGSSNLLALLQEALPGAIPQGTEFASAFQFTLTDGGQLVTLLPIGSSLSLAFKLPDGATPNDHYAILYWDPTANSGTGGWVELPKYAERLDGVPLGYALHPDADPADGMRIFSGTRTLGDYVKATVNFTGVFVLIKK